MTCLARVARLAHIKIESATPGFTAANINQHQGTSASTTVHGQSSNSPRCRRRTDGFRPRRARAGAAPRSVA
jgi:hypothetical protein